MTEAGERGTAGLKGKRTVALLREVHTSQQCAYWLDFQGDTTTGCGLLTSNSA